MFEFPFLCDENLLTFFAGEEDVVGSDFGPERDPVFVGDCDWKKCRLLRDLHLFLMHQRVCSQSGSCQEDVWTFVAWKIRAVGVDFFPSLGYVLDLDA